MRLAAKEVKHLSEGGWKLKLLLLLLPWQKKCTHYRRRRHTVGTGETGKQDEICMQTAVQQFCELCKREIARRGKANAHGREVNCHDQLTCTSLRRIINFMAWRTGPTAAACFQDVTKNLRDLFGSFNSPPAADDRQLSDYFHFIFFRKNRNEMRFFSGLSSTCVHEGWAKRVKKIFNMWWWTWLVPRRKHTTTLHGSIFFLFSLLLIDRVRQPSLIGRQWKHFSAFLFSSSWVCPRKKKTVSISEKLTRAHAHLN